MMTSTDIHGHEHVVKILGHWPSFHDAEVLRFCLVRGAHADERKAEVELDLQVREYEIQNAGTPDYQLALSKNIIIQFVFTDIAALKLDDFNFQNVINGLHLRRTSDLPDSEFQVEVESIFGLEASWTCKTARVQNLALVEHETTKVIET